MQAREEFYVGYVDRAPPATGRFVRRVVVSVMLALAATIAIVAASQDPLPSGVFEFGVQRDFEGVLYVEPLPYLRVVGPSGDGGRAATNLLLVGLGKHGLPEEFRRHDGRKVSFRGSLIYRENLAMVEMNDPASFREVGQPGPEEARPRSGSVAEVALTGELVDTKCWLGVMRPATGKVHRACAVRCLKGGVPPGLLVRDPEGNATVFMLVGREGHALGFDLQMAARSVEVRGRLEFADGLPVIHVTRMGLI